MDLLNKLHDRVYYSICIAILQQYYNINSADK